ncbi:ovarian cancer-associated protein 2 protein [Trichinella spiralis]|uniref:ovarian cancer-associated protein 2 protein n=1 Tax=Trichinella spiralis TaxID=6334 RepID=UPI0001EFB4E1|nr:ovarian cancer-associated protein 2 protein [Trichinella spiralis]
MKAKNTEATCWQVAKCVRLWFTSSSILVTDCLIKYILIACSFVVAMPTGKRETERKGNAPVNTGPSPNSDGRANNTAEEVNELVQGSDSLQNYVDAPHFSNHSDNDAEIEARSWWFSQENNRFSSKDITDLCTEFQHRIRFAILISGFVSKSSGHITLQQQELNIPSLHIVGQADEIVPKEMSLALANRFVSPHVVEHDGGHYVPSKRPTREALKSFIQQFIV